MQRDEKERTRIQAKRGERDRERMKEMEKENENKRAREGLPNRPRPHHSRRTELPSNPTGPLPQLAPRPPRSVRWLPDNPRLPWIKAGRPHTHRPQSQPVSTLQHQLPQYHIDAGGSISRAVYWKSNRFLVWTGAARWGGGRGGWGGGGGGEVGGV